MQVGAKTGPRQLGLHVAGRFLLSFRANGSGADLPGDVLHMAEGGLGGRRR